MPLPDHAWPHDDVTPTKCDIWTVVHDTNGLAILNSNTHAQLHDVENWTSDNVANDFLNSWQWKKKWKNKQVDTEVSSSLHVTFFLRLLVDIKYITPK